MWLQWQFLNVSTVPAAMLVEEPFQFATRVTCKLPPGSTPDEVKFELRTLALTILKDLAESPDAVY